jgi:hypothetical protein
MASRQELEQLASNPLADEQQRERAQAAFKALESVSSTGEFNLPEWWADLARTDRDPVRRAHKFKQLRETYNNNPSALRSFTPERENLRAKRDVYDLHGGDVIGAAFDEEIPELLAEKGIGYYGTALYYVEMRGLTPEAAAEAAKRHMEGLHQSAIIDDGFRSGKLVKDCCKNSMQSLGSR